MTRYMRDHQFLPHKDHPEICGLMLPTGRPWPAPHTQACAGTPEDHPTTQEEETVTLPQHSRFGAWTPAANVEGDQYKPREHYGNHAIVKVVEYKDSVVTPNSPNGAPGIIVDVHDLNKKETFRDVLMMTGAIVDTFKPHVGGAPLVVQWEKRVAKNGRDYAAPAPAVEAAIAAAEAVYANGDPFAPAIGTIDAEPPF
jgi:hypothetical protein